MNLNPLERGMITYALGIVYAFVEDGNKMNSLVADMVDNVGEEETLKFLFSIKEKMKEE